MSHTSEDLVLLIEGSKRIKRIRASAQATAERQAGKTLQEVANGLNADAIPRLGDHGQTGRRGPAEADRGPPGEVDLPPGSGGGRSEYQAASRKVSASMLARASAGVR